MLKHAELILISLILPLLICSCKSDPESSSGKAFKVNYSRQLPFQNNFYSVEFTDENTGWAVGKGGIIYKTVNGGATWNIQTSGTTDNLIKVQFIGEQTGWIAGENCLLFTSNGGSTWQTKLQNIPFSRFLSMQFIDGNTGWISGTPDGKIYHTSDCGKTWEVQQADSLGRIVEVSFVNTSVGYSLSNIRGVYKTTDGGSHWSSMSTPRFCSALYALNESFAVAGNNIMPSSRALDQAEVFISNDGGRTWNNETIPRAIAVWKVMFLDNLRGFAIAGVLSGFGNNDADWVECGKFLYTSNGGNDWAFSDEEEFSKKQVIDFKSFKNNNLYILTTDGTVYFAHLY